VLIMKEEAKGKVEQERFYVEYILGCGGWTTAAIGRALDYKGGEGLAAALAREGGLSEERSARLKKLAESLPGAAVAPPGPGERWPLTDRMPFEAAKAADVVPTAVPPKAPAEVRAAHVRVNTMDVLQDASKDLDRAIKRLLEHVPDALPILRPGLHEAVKRIEDVKRYLCV
jgi:hypothetical protein